MPGFDPGIHRVPLAQMADGRYGRNRVDDRVKPDHDDLGLHC
jgi:hypothetical protein